MIGYLAGSYDELLLPAGITKPQSLPQEQFKTIGTETKIMAPGSHQQQQNNTTPPLTISQSPLPSALPKRLITVLGLESSGTTFLTKIISKAVGATFSVGNDDLHYTSRNAEIQHVSLPWGYWHSDGVDENSNHHDIPIIEWIPPRKCMIFPTLPPRQVTLRKSQMVVPELCQSMGITEFPDIPRRFFLNISSHIAWYRKFGVDATAVILVRDENLHLHGKLAHHNKHMLNRAQEEDAIGKEIIRDAIERLERDSEILLASYETLMSLQDIYLFDLYRKLRIQSSYIPEFKDGNSKYIKHLPATQNTTRMHENR